MSDFVPRDTPPDLWDEILKRHWIFLETEESLEKIEERKKLEGCLKEFLCVVPHDRKFFLPETAHVLRKTVRELDEFTANKAIAGFEAISQYANNLFTRPWRKEYRVIKMYSGFFTHEVKANLMDPIKLFEAMGYQLVSANILQLDGPICPDQVLNVSRDAMAAHVECQIMKHIYSGITALGLSCTWKDVYHYREQNIGGSTQAIKGFAFTLQERRFAKEKASKTDNVYATIQHSQAPATIAPKSTNECQNCASFRHGKMQQQLQKQLFHGPCAVHSNNNNNNGCVLHANNNNFTMLPSNILYNDNNSKMLASYPAANYQQQACAVPGIHQYEAHGHLMPQSRSLDHYSEPQPPPLIPHRHSFDHHPQSCMAYAHHYPYPQGQHLYESAYDCISGSSMETSSGGHSYAAVGGLSACSYNSAYADPYNVSGNRYPLPPNISNQLSSHYDTPAACSGGAAGNLLETDFLIDDGAKYCHPAVIEQQQQQQQQGSSLLFTRHPFSKDYPANRQRSFPPDQYHLVDYDDRAPLTDHDFHAQLHTRSQNNSLDYGNERGRSERVVQQRATEKQAFSKKALAAGMNRLSLNSTDALPNDTTDGKEIFKQQKTANVDGNYAYSKPGSRAVENLTNGSRLSEKQRCGQRYAREDVMATKTTDKYLRHPERKNEMIEFNRRMQTELNERRATQADQRFFNGRANISEEGTAAELVSDRETSDVCYESSPFDGSSSEHTARTQHSPTQAIKNQDGVGSFESWDYVFKNLDRSGYSKDLGERGDLLVESLLLDSLNGASTSTAAANGSGDKRRSSHVIAADSKAERSVIEENVHLKQSKTLTSAPPEQRLDSAKSSKSKSEKSILKQGKSSKASANVVAAGKTKINPTLKSVATSNINNKNTNNNNNNESHDRPQQNKTAQTNKQNYNQSGKGQSNTNSRVVKKPPPVATQVIISSPDEWSCRFCTFLNPNTKKICEMCCHSRDFNVDNVVVPNTPTCV